MADISVKLPDVGDGIAEAELTAWNVAVGDVIQEDDILAEVMTDKAAVEIPSPVTGRIIALNGTPGEMLAIGSELVVIQSDQSLETPAPPPKPSTAMAPPSSSDGRPPVPQESVQRRHSKPLAAPSVRRKARNMRLDLSTLQGTGPSGRITHEDLAAGQALTPPNRPARNDVEKIPVIGLRRKIAEQMVRAATRIPHITLTEEVNVTALEDLRGDLSAKLGQELTPLPFITRALVEAVTDAPEINALFDEAENLHILHGGIHVGIATQTDSGLMVPVLRNAETQTLAQIARRITTLTQQARVGQATREDLTGSTITISSLGPMGTLSTTPIINHPEVAIIGVNRIAIRPLWDGSAFVPRKMLTLSCSFDHRVIDGWDAALFVRDLKTRLESPALLLVET